MVSTTNQVLAWHLDEASGTREDAHGANDLTDNNTVTSGAAKLGTAAAQFASASSEYLSINDNADLSVGDIDFSFAFWMRPEANAGGSAVFSKDGTDGLTDGAYELRWSDDVAARLTWLIRQSGGADCARVSSNAFGNMSNDTWYFVGVYHDAANNIAGVGVNDTWNTVSTAGTPFDNGGRFTLGCRSYLSGFYNGRIDEFAMWKRMLTSQEWTDLYNAGTGLAYPYSSTAQKAFGGLARTSVKIVSPLAIANVKNKNGLA